MTSRPARASHARSSARSSSVGSAKLVSIDDVRAHTQVPESLNRDPLPPRPCDVAFKRLLPRRSHHGGSGAPAPGEHAYRACGRRSDRERSESLNSLFTSTSDDAPSVSGPSGSGVAVQTATTASGATVATATATTAAFDPFDAYAGAGAVKHNPSRSVTVLKPASYAEVERIAKALKAGDVVVLALRNTPDNLSKRILDFSFGVSSALDASVDCVPTMVFVISGAVLRSRCPSA